MPSGVPRLLGANHLNGDVELEIHEGDLGGKHRRISIGRDLLQVLYAIDAGGEEARVAHLFIDLRARRLHGQLAGEFHGDSL